MALILRFTPCQFAGQTAGIDRGRVKRTRFCGGSLGEEREVVWLAKWVSDAEAFQAALTAWIIGCTPRMAITRLRL